MDKENRYLQAELYDMDSSSFRLLRISLPHLLFPDRRGGIHASLLTIFLCAVALSVRLAMAPVDAGLQYVTFFPAITLAAFTGGYRAGLLATAFGLVLATFLFTAPYYSFSFEAFQNAFWANIVFLTDGLVVTFSLEAMHKYRQQSVQALQRSEAARLEIQSLALQLQSSESFKETIMNSIAAEIAVIDGKGTILAVNQKWRHFSLENSGEPDRPAPQTEVGANYLAACDTIAGREAGSGIRAVLDGSRPSFSLEYPCPSPRQPRWFEMRVLPLVDQDTGGAVVITHTDITRLKQAQEDLQKQLNFDETLIATAQVIILLLDTKGRIVRFNPYMEAICGHTLAEVQGKDWFSTFLPEPVASELHDIFLKAISDFQTRGNITPMLTRLGEERSIEWYSKTLKDSNGLPLGLLSIGQDITERRNAEADLRIAAATFEASQDGIVITDPNGIILRINRSFTETTGYSAAEAVERTPSILKSGHHDTAFYAEMWQTLLATGSWQGEIWDRRKNGEVYPKWLRITAVRTADGTVTHFVAVHSDITEKKAAEDAIKNLAFYDPLTQLPNRRLLLDRLRQTLAASIRSGREGALLFIDMDNFKTVNDSLGHDKGDLLLQEIGRRLSTCIREGDTVARLGGDEFVVMLVDLHDMPAQAAAQAETVGGKILAALGQVYTIAGHDIRCTPSIGITLFGDQRGNMDELLKQADIAMYQGKASGRNAMCFFDPALGDAVQSRVTLESDLRLGIGANQLLLHYQPQMDAEGRLIGAEALVRWRHPERGLLPPAEFIPRAEETGLILPLGQWVLETACGQLAIWSTQPGLADLTVAVNVSAHQFRHRDFVDKVLKAIKNTGANAKRLKLELTESLFIENIQDITEKMFALKGKGVGFSLDDFGTGYSSLSYLKRLPLEQLKIDRSFIQDVLTDPNDAAIARTIVTLAQSLQIGVIAEGVETADQRNFLASSGCPAYQGFFYSKPLPVEDFEQFAIRCRGE